MIPIIRKSQNLKKLYLEKNNKSSALMLTNLKKELILKKDLIIVNLSQNQLTNEQIMNFSFENIHIEELYFE